MTLQLTDVPVEGVVHEPYVWPDVLATLPPERPIDGAYCVPGPEIEAGAHRIEHALLAREAGDGSVEMELRVGIVDRVMARAIVKERKVFRRVPGFGSVTRGLATFPDKMRSRTSKTIALLATPAGRSRFRQGLADPHALSGEQKAITLFVGTLALVASALLLHVVVTLAAPSLAGAWRAGEALFLYGYVSSVGIPLPWEPVLVAAARLMGIAPAISIGVAAKLVAGYMVFFLGDEMNEKLERRARERAWFRRFLSWSERFAARWGVFAMALFIGTPGLPDAIALYVFGALRMPLWKYLLGILLGALALDALAIFGVAQLLRLT